MTNLTRWEPVHEFMSLREAMDRLLDDAFTHPIGADGITALPAIDLYETDDDVVVKAVLPGIKAEDVQISVTGDVFTLRGELQCRLALIGIQPGSLEFDRPMSPVVRRAARRVAAGIREVLEELGFVITQ